MGSSAPNAIDWKKLREDFPILDQRINGHPLIYFDNGATAQASASSNAPAVAYLLSDLASQVNGQILRIDGDNLSLVSHPAVMLPALHKAGGWTAETIAEAFGTKFAGKLPPVGFTGIEVSGYGMPASIWSDAATG